MNAPLFSLSLLAGTALVFLLPRLPAIAAALACFVIAAGLHLRSRGIFTAALAVFAGAFVWAVIDGQAGLDSRLSPAHGKIDRQVQATVVSLVRELGTTVAFQVETDLSPELPGMLRADLRWYEFPATGRRPRPGEIWQLNVRLWTPRGSANPGQRYWEDQAFRRGTGASGYVRRGDNRYVSTHSWRGMIERLRDALSRKLIARLSDHQSAPLIVALAVGDRQYLSDSHWQVLRQTGLSHLVAISGLHIGIVAGLTYVLAAAVAGTLAAARNTISTSSPGAGRGHAIVLACCASATAALGYAALAGFTIPTQRALVVVVVFLTARLSRRVVRPLHALSIALALILLADPRSVLDAGFWLSFAAVAVILYAGAGQSGRRRFADLWRMQFAVMIGLAPLMIVFFGQLSVAAPLVNFVLLPLFSLLIVPAVLSGVVVQFVAERTGLAILRLVATLLDTIWTWLIGISEVGLMVRPLASPSVVATALAVVGVFWILAPRGWPARGLGVICLCPALMSLPTRPAPGSYALTMLDVGQGLAVVVQTHRRVLVYDAGPKWRSGNDAARQIIVPYLHWSGSSHVDRLIASHGDADHAGGLATLRDRFPDAAILGSGVADVENCIRGQRWFWDGVGFEFLHPLTGSAWSDNNASCVLRISDDHGCTLLTGDIEADAETALVRGAASQLRCDLVLAPHHGSATSSTPGFVTATGARLVLVSAGYSNQWGFPRPEVVDRWHRAGAAVLNTATAGAITVLVNAEGQISTHLQRCEDRRFWRAECSSISTRSDH